MGWENSDRRDRLPADWEAIRKAVFRRDLYRCRWQLPGGDLCRAVATDVDHIVAGDDHSMSNLQALCRPHHERKSALEGVEARRQKKDSSRLPPDASTLGGGLRQRPTGALPWE